MGARFSCSKCETEGAVWRVRTCRKLVRRAPCVDAVVAECWHLRALRKHFYIIAAESYIFNNAQALVTA